MIRKLWRRLHVCWAVLRGRGFACNAIVHGTIEFSDQAIVSNVVVVNDQLRDGIVAGKGSLVYGCVVTGASRAPFPPLFSPPTNGGHNAHLET